MHPCPASPSPGTSSAHYPPAAPRDTAQRPTLLPRIEPHRMLCNHQTRPHPPNRLQRRSILFLQRIRRIQNTMSARCFPSSLNAGAAMTTPRPSNPSDFRFSPISRTPYCASPEKTHARPAAQRLNSHRAGSRIRVQKRRARDPRRQNIEQRLAQPVRRGTRLHPRECLDDRASRNSPPITRIQPTVTSPYRRCQWSRM